MKSPSRRMVNGGPSRGTPNFVDHIRNVLASCQLAPVERTPAPDATTTGIMPYVQFGGRGQRSRGLEEAIPPCGDVPSTEYVCGRRSRSKG